MTIETIVEGREKYDDDENNDINNDVEDEYREKFETRRKQKYEKK